MKRYLSLFFAALLVFSSMCMPALSEGGAGDVVAEGEYSEQLTWALDSAGVLTITGTGEVTSTSKLEDLKERREDVRSVIIEEGVTGIGDYAFQYFGNLTEVKLPESLESIAGWAFEYCHQLSKVEIPSGVSTIDAQAFAACEGLSAIEVSEANPNFASEGGVLFDKEKTELLRCPQAITGSYAIPEGVAVIGSYAFYDCVNLTDIAIPDGVTEIKHSAFNRCVFTGISIPSSVQAIRTDCFDYCEQLTAIEVAQDSASFSSVDGLLYDKAGETLLRCPMGKSGSFVIPEGTTSIGDYALWGCTQIVEVVFPETLTVIGRGAFASCYGLTEISIPESVTKIADDAFVYCDALTDITIPASVTEIEGTAFRNCDNLTIHGPAGSCAEAYALENEIPFVAE